MLLNSPRVNEEIIIVCKHFFYLKVIEMWYIKTGRTQLKMSLNVNL